MSIETSSLLSNNRINDQYEDENPTICNRETLRDGCCLIPQCSFLGWGCKFFIVMGICMVATAVYRGTHQNDNNAKLPGMMIGVAGVGAFAIGAFLCLFPRCVESYREFRATLTPDRVRSLATTRNVETV